MGLLGLGKVTLTQSVKEPLSHTINIYTMKPSGYQVWIHDKNVNGYFRQWTYKGSYIHDFIFNRSWTINGKLVGDLLCFATSSLCLWDLYKSNTYTVNKRTYSRHYCSVDWDRELLRNRGSKKIVTSPLHTPRWKRLSNTRMRNKPSNSSHPAMRWRPRLFSWGARSTMHWFS